jgi:hypothetical protein
MLSGGGVKSIALRHAFAVLFQRLHAQRGIGESMPPADFLLKNLDVELSESVSRP